MKRFLIALQFLTILPITIKKDVTGKDLGKATLFFPVVGALIGLVLAFVSLANLFLSPMIAAALILITNAVITGGLHLDGFMDSCDGLYGIRTKEQRLEIMRDSHVGSIGVLGLALLLLLKFALLASFPEKILFKAVLVMPAFARWLQVLACLLLNYAHIEGKGKNFFYHTTLKEALFASLFTVIFFIVILKTQGLILLGLALLPIPLFILIVKQKLGGMTGDTVGALSEIAEISLLLASLMITTLNSL